MCASKSPGISPDSRHTTDMQTPAIGYIRVSTQKQADEGMSLDVQRERIRQYAELYNLNILEVVEDAGFSASTIERPGLQRALALLKAHRAEVLIVAKLDRLSRSVCDLGLMIQDYFTKKAAVVSVAENLDTRSASGRLVINLLASVAQWEREAIGERTASSMQAKRIMGEYTGGHPPFGYELAANGSHLVANAREQEWIAAALELRGQGLSYAKIAHGLTTKGFVTREGNPPNANSVFRILRDVTAPKVRVP